MDAGQVFITTSKSQGKYHQFTVATNNFVNTTNVIIVVSKKVPTIQKVL